MTLLQCCTSLPNLMDHMLSKLPQTITVSVFSNQSLWASLNCGQAWFLSSDEIESKRGMINDWEYYSREREDFRHLSSLTVRHKLNRPKMVTFCSRFALIFKLWMLILLQCALATVKSPEHIVINTNVKHKNLLWGFSKSS